jgi:hypothetical protein
MIKYKLPNGITAYKYLLLVAFANYKEFTEAEKHQIRERVFKRSINGITMTFETQNILGSGVMAFDNYIIEELNFLQRIRHVLRVFKTTVFDYIGISAVGIVVKT